MSRYLEMKDLVGLKVFEALVDEDKHLVVLKTDQGTLYLSWHGDCCADCYLENMSGVDALIGGTIQAVESSEWKSVRDDDCDYIDSMGTKIRTNKGYVDFETRVSHNGYYGGRIDIERKAPDYGYKPKKLRPLTDF